MSARDERGLSVIFHDLRTPLSVIVGYAELLQTRDDDATRRTAADAISEAAEALGRALVEFEATLRADRVSAAEPTSAPSAGAYLGSPKRVLIVDDDENIRALLRMTLPVDDFTVIEAADGNEALTVAARELPDIVLLDWQMPGRGGAAVLAALRREHPSLPLVVLTADRDQVAQEQAHELGASAFLTKPFSPIQLLGAVEDLLAG